MVTNMNPVNSEPLNVAPIKNPPPLLPTSMNVGRPKDSVEFGKGEKLSMEQSMTMVMERAMEKLRSVVSDARAELGIPEDQVLDTSPDATANRIADFALNFFSKYAENNKLANDESGRKQFADFIGNAINQGISEARDILGALNAINGDVDGNINKTADIIQGRLDDFVANGL